MTPLDDHLRTTLHHRADGLTPSSDPLGGIEARARGMRRRKVAATVAGAALAAAAVGFAVPSLVGERSAPSTRVAASAEAQLDPAHPWAFRGDINGKYRESFQAAWQVKHPGSTMTLLFAQTYEPSRQVEAVFVASGPDGARSGFVTLSSHGAEFVIDRRLEPKATAVAVRVMGDETARILVVAAPSSRLLEYADDGRTFQALTVLAPGVGTGPESYGGDPPAPTVRVTAADGTIVHQAPPARAGDVEPDAQPANLVDWPTRGVVDADVLLAARSALETSLGGPVEVKLLFGGGTGSGVRYVMGQAWLRGSATAGSFAYTARAVDDGQLFLGPKTESTAVVLAFLINSLPGTPTDLLVVVPAPRTSQVLYDDNATGTFRPVSTDGADGVVLIDRSRTASADRLQLLTGNGDPATDVTYEGPVAPLLCGSKGCG